MPHPAMNSSVSIRTAAGDKIASSPHHDAGHIESQDSKQHTTDNITGVMDTEINSRNTDHRYNSTAYKVDRDPAPVSLHVTRRNDCQSDVSGGGCKRMSAWKRQACEFHKVRNERGTGTTEYALQDFKPHLRTCSRYNHSCRSSMIPHNPQQTECGYRNQDNDGWRAERAYVGHGPVQQW